MEVSGQTAPRGKYSKLCNFCEDYDITTCAEGFCAECDVYICYACFGKHKRRQVNANHSMVTIEDANTAKTSIEESATESRKTDYRRKAIITAMLFEPRFCRNINVDGDILSFEAKAHSGFGVFVFSERYTLEIEILALGKSGSIAIGHVQDTQFPVSISDSEGYFSDGKYFQYGTCSMVGQAWKVGDHIRCIIKDCFGRKRHTVKFFHNGKMVIISDYLNESCYIAVGMAAVGDKVKVIISDENCSIQ